jgi:DNA-binding winged helix-turn-helix (wHTH) protein/tetratricopeptide (TPR) repeat protein
MALKKQQGKYRFQDFEVDLGHRSLRREGHSVAIGPLTFDLLAFFVFHPQRPVAKEELMEALWPDSQVEENSLTQQIFLLRGALTGSESGDQLLVTLPGRGYEFTAPVTAEPVAAKPSRRPLLHASHAENSEAATGHDAGHDPDQGTPSAHHNPAPRFFADFRHPGPWHVLIITALVAILGFGGLFGWRYMHRPTQDSLGLVIADFQNATSESHFEDALKTALTIDLQQSPYLRIATGRQVADKLVAMKLAQAGSPVPPLTADLVRQACVPLSDQAYVTGEVHRFAVKYLVTLQAFDCASGQSLANSKGIADTPDGVVIVLDKVAADLRKQLGESSASVARFSKPLFTSRTSSLEALKDYAIATHFDLEGKPDDAISFFKHAVELDPQFAIAFADLGAAYSNSGQRDLAKASLAKAYELRDSVDESGRLFIASTYNDIVIGDIQAGIRNYKGWSEEYPHNPAPFISLADLEIQAGKPALALDPAKRSIELNSDNAMAYVVLAQAQMRLGQFEQASDTCHRAIDHNLDGEQIHGFLLQIAFLRLDQAEIDKQIAWAKGTQAEPYMLLQQALIDFASGKAKVAATAFNKVAEAYRKLGQNERAKSMLAQVPRIESELGLTDVAYEMLTHLTETEGANNANESLDLELVDVPVAWAHVGETSRARALLKRELDAHPTGTLWQEDYAPQIKAAIALNQHRPEDAIDALKPAISYELNGFEIPALLGRAYLANKQPDLAEAEFHKILDHPGIEPLSRDYPLAQLGVARALAAQGKTVEAGFAYKVVLQIWKDADPDLPRLKEAKAEYAKLNAPPPKTKLASNRPTLKQAASKRQF